MLASLTWTSERDWLAGYLQGMDSAMNRWPRKARLHTLSNDGVDGECNGSKRPTASGVVSGCG